jgi:hypothetical protein
MRGYRLNRKLKNEREQKSVQGRIVHERRKLGPKLPVTIFKTLYSLQ